MATAFQLLTFAQSAARSEVIIERASGLVRKTERTGMGRVVAQTHFAAGASRTVGLVNDADSSELVHLCLWDDVATAPVIVASGPAPRMDALCRQVSADLRLRRLRRAGGKGEESRNEKYQNARHGQGTIQNYCFRNSYSAGRCDSNPHDGKFATGSCLNCDCDFRAICWTSIPAIRPPRSHA